MKRDLVLTRKILEFIVTNYDPGKLLNVTVEGYDDKMVYFYVSMLSDGGLLDRTDPAPAQTFQHDPGQPLQFFKRFVVHKIPVSG